MFEEIETTFDPMYSLEEGEQAAPGSYEFNPAHPQQFLVFLAFAAFMVGIALFKMSSLVEWPAPLLAVEKAAPFPVAVAAAVPPLPTAPPASQQVNSGEACTVSAKYPVRITQWCALITQYATQRGLSPDLVAALIWIESGGNPQAYSRSGAVGLMQVMPNDGLAAAFNCANGPCFKDRPSTNQLMDPEFNVSFGTKYLASLLRRSGDLREALKSYGPAGVGYSYADKVMAIYTQYKQ